MMKDARSASRIIKNYRVGDLYLTGHSIKSLPNNLHVSGNLIVRECSQLESLPNGLTVGGYLDARNCVSLRNLPEDLKVGSLLLTGCKSIRKIPDSYVTFIRNNALHTDHCTSLVRLPNTFEGMTFSELNLMGCSSLQYLPGNMTVTDFSDLRDCTSLKSLPINFTTNQLWIPGCSSLQLLPETLKVNNALIFEDDARHLFGKYLPCGAVYSSFNFLDNIIMAFVESIPISAWCRENGIVISRRELCMKPFPIHYDFIEDAAQLMHYRLKWE